MQPIIREAQDDDLAIISRLLVDGNDLHRQALPVLFAASDLPATEKYVSSALRDEMAYILVAELNGQVAGFVMFRVGSHGPPLVSGSYVSVSTLVVRESCRRQGLGKALMTRVHEWAREHDIEELDLNVYEFNRAAIGFYEKLGYQTTSRRMKRLSLESCPTNQGGGNA